MDLRDVITLGHPGYFSLLGQRTELVDGFEPHSTIYLAGHREQHADHVPPVVGGCTRGGDVGGSAGWVYRYLASDSPSGPEYDYI